MKDKKILKVAREINSAHRWLLIRNQGGQKVEGLHIKSAERKKTVNQEFYNLWKYPSKNKGEIRTFPDKQKQKIYG